MKQEVIQVNGMSCDHCVQTVTTALKAINGVSEVRVDLEEKVVTVDFEENQTDLKTLSAKINDAGFEVTGG